MAYSLPIKYYNSFLLKKVQTAAVGNDNLWPGLPWTPTKDPYTGSSIDFPPFPFGKLVPPTPAGTFEISDEDWYIEEARIKGGFNNTTVDFGVRAYVVEETNRSNHSESSLIFSGVLNNATGLNNTNVFSIGEKIDKSLNPVDGSIQKIYASDTNLVVFQESKTNKLLINKNTVYSGSQGAQESLKALILGQVYPYAGKYGISTHPESFGVFSNRKYFTDQNQGLVCRLSNDGITEINRYGMRDYFRDYLSTITTTWQEDLTDITLIFIVDGDGNLSPVVKTGDFSCNVSPGSSVYLDGVKVQNTETGKDIYLRDAQSPTTAGVVATLTVADDGSGYTSGTRGTTGGSGTGLGVTIVADGAGRILSATVLGTGGSGYKVGDVVDVAAPGTGGQLTVASLVNETIFYFSSDNVQAWNPSPPLSASTSYTVSFGVQVTGRIFGGWDIHSDSYALSMQPLMNTSEFSTLTFEESSNGWTSRHSYKPQFMTSLREQFYSTYRGSVWRHYDNTTINNRTSYYGSANYSSSIEFIFNDQPSIGKNFLTIGYEGSSGWEVTSIKSDFEGFDYKYYTSPAGGFEQDQDTTNSVLSFLKGKYEIATPANSGIAAITPPFAHAGFTRKENKYVANLKNNSTVRPGEVIYGSSVSGIKGYYATVLLSTDNITQVGGEKELFLVSSNYSVSSY